MKKSVWTQIYTIGKQLKYNVIEYFVNSDIVIKLMFILFMFVIRRQNLLPDFISVTIPDKDDPLNSKRIIVEIINVPIIKPFLGGYVNRQTGIYIRAFELFEGKSC